jgi:succinyl-diaminopimelate desuccinylase
MDVVSLTKKLLSFNSINPPGNEAEIARYTGELLERNGFHTSYYTFSDRRLHLIAEKGLIPEIPPVVFSGHFDTVPLGIKKWSIDPFVGEIKENKIYGRGSSDMKGALASMICGAIESFSGQKPKGGVRLIFTAAEELGCQGAQQLVRVLRNAGKARAIIVGEPTSNKPAIAHKGAIYFNLVTTGKTAHSSMPHLGDNAIYKAATAILKARDFNFEAEKDELLGFPTINVGKMVGGMNLNSVPDHAEFSIDIRTSSRVDHDLVIEKLSRTLGKDVEIEVLVNLKAVSTPHNDPFVMKVYGLCGIDPANGEFPMSLPYLTDGSVLQGFYGGVPTVILGPGEAGMAHQTDEFCYIDKLEQSVNIYKNILIQGGKND